MTPVRPIELIVSKIIPYFLVASLGFLLCVSIAVLGYDVPLKGSWAVLAISSAEYIIVAVCLGLTISSIVKSNFSRARWHFLSAYCLPLCLADLYLTCTVFPILFVL